MRHLPIAVAGVLLVAGCGGQPRTGPAPFAPIAGDSEVRVAASLITADKALARVGVIADDSMAGRNTPSVGLEATARYLADAYRTLGLVPLGDSGGFIQRYTLQRVHAGAESFLTVFEAGTPVRLPLAGALVAGPMTGTPVTGPVKVLAGTVTVADVTPLTLRGTIVVLIQRPDRTTDNQAVARAVMAQAPAAIIVVQQADSATFRARVDSARTFGNPQPVVAAVPASGVLTITVTDRFFDSLPDAPDFAAMRRAPAPVIMDGPSTVSINIVASTEIVSTATAPNVVAMMPGRDSLLRREYVVFSAHMDHVGRAGDGVGGCTAIGADSICNGADDDGSGTTGILSIAEAVARLRGRTRRSIVFLNVSGEEQGLLGSAYFTAHPPFALSSAVADINMDMIGRNSPDSIVVIGTDQSDLGGTLAGIQAAHPELHLTAADDIRPDENVYSRSDQFNFARRGIPVLFFFSGVHPQYHRPDDEVGLINTDKLARVARLGFYLGVTLADTLPKPQWNPDSYRKIAVP